MNSKQCNGKLIVFEGIDNVGKSMICSAVNTRLLEHGFQCAVYSFPGQTEGTIGKVVYDIHHDCGVIKSASIDALSLQTLHLAAHIDTLNQKIVPDVFNGKIVLLDRSWWSTIAYGSANGLNEDILRELIQPELRIVKQLTTVRYIYITRDNVQNDYSASKTNAVLKAYKKLCDNCIDGCLEIIGNDKDIESAISAAFMAIIKE